MDDAEIANRFATLERNRAVDRVTGAVAKPGTKDCRGCGDEIPHARRVAAPFADHCIDCQQKEERRQW